MTRDEIQPRVDRMASIQVQRLLPTLCLLMGSLGQAAEPPTDWVKLGRTVPKGYVCERALKAPTLDGKLDDSAWSGAAWTDAFADIEGGARPAPN